MEQHKDQNELVSVIIPIYNVEQYLDRCLASILNQTYTNIEIILVDDGSTDNSGKICDEYVKKDNRIKVIHKKNGGLSSARNAGLDIAIGKYIKFVDSDDWLELDAIQYLYSLLHRFNADFSMGANIRIENVNGNRISEIFEQCLSQKEFLNKFFKIGTQENVQYAWAKLYKRELFSEVRYPLGLIAEDVPATFQVAIRSSRIAYSTKNVYHYFINCKSITGIGFNEKTFDLLKVWDLVFDTANKMCANEIKEMAMLNRKRADFGILFNYVISNRYNKVDKETYNKISLIRSNLRQNLLYLLKANIPMSRKMIMVCFCYAFGPTAFIINFIYLKLLKDKNIK